MRYSGYELLWMFAVYSVAGWCLEVCAAAAKQKKFVNRGYLNGPFCPVYGLTSAAFGIVLPELKEHLIFLFLGGMIIAAFAEYICGFLLERISGQKWWDYSGHRFSARGYICLPASLFWGICAVLCIRLFDPLLVKAYLYASPKGRNAYSDSCIDCSILDGLGSSAAVLQMHYFLGRQPLRSADGFMGCHPFLKMPSQSGSDAGW